MRRWNPAMLACLLTAALAGCADDAAPTDDDAPGVGATDTTGGIRGVVVDAAIVPLMGATVTLPEEGRSTTTDEEGLFVFSDLMPGTYIVTATHPLYNVQQTTAIVEAGVEEPKMVRMQLTRIILEEPTHNTQYFEGYISCSANIVLFLSEECGEGVGSPENTCNALEFLVGSCMGAPNVDNPILPGERIGKAAGNVAQIDFFIEPNATTLLAEVFWTPSLSPSASPSGQKGTFNMGIYTDFLCDPGCNWDKQIDRADGGSPLYLRSDTDEEGDYPRDTAMADLEYDGTTRFSTFTWAGADETGFLLEQEFTVYVTASYHLPLPDGWSIEDGVDPF